MKFIPALAMTLFSISSMAAGELKLNCDVVTLLDDNVFEEGLGETGDSNSDEDSQSVDIDLRAKNKYISIGQHNFDTTEKDMKVTKSETEKQINITVQMGQVQTVKLKISKLSLKGIILQKDQDEAKYKTVAEIDCNDTTELKKAMKNGKAKRTKISESDIPKVILEKMLNVDVGFELGDGYYDLQREDLYQYELKGKVIGYERHSFLSYTEGDDAEASTMFLANGVRFSGPTE